MQCLLMVTVSSRTSYCMPKYSDVPHVITCNNCPILNSLQLSSLTHEYRPTRDKCLIQHYTVLSRTILMATILSRTKLMATVLSRTVLMATVMSRTVLMATVLPSTIGLLMATLLSRTVGYVGARGPCGVKSPCH